MLQVNEYAADQWLLRTKWYRFDKKTGNDVTGWYQKSGDKGLVLSVGERKYGNRLVPVGGRWYYLSASGEMAHDGTTPDG